MAGIKTMMAWPTKSERLLPLEEVSQVAMRDVAAAFTDIRSAKTRRTGIRTARVTIRTKRL